MDFTNVWEGSSAHRVLVIARTARTKILAINHLEPGELSFHPCLNSGMADLSWRKFATIKVAANPKIKTNGAGRSKTIVPIIAHKRTNAGKYSCR